MIEFDHALPAMHVNGGNNGTYNNYEGVLPLVYTTKDARLGIFLHDLHNAVHDDRRIVLIDGKVLKCSNNWIRDHVHEMKAFKHWEYDLKSFLAFIIDTQAPSGQYYELIKQLDDVHWSYVDDNCRKFYRDDNVALVRLELEADIEYLVVEGVLQYYRATGDLDWVLSVLPRLEKGIDYVTSDEKRWDKQHGLVKRLFTIDTWDFTNEKDAGTDRRIHENAPMSIMHGDNSGVFMAMNILASFREKAGDAEKAASWRKRAAALRENMFRYLWNGKFFMHQYHLNHKGLDGREGERLSLSNPYDVNRGVTNTEQARSIIQEYMSRRKTTRAFAEWFSIDPPYESFHGNAAGVYVNGAISPFTAGELAKAALENGYEAYGWDIISRFMQMVERDKTIYFLYSPDTSERQGGGPSAWGAAALMSAVEEGLAGIVDADCLYREINFSPRFPVTDYTELRFVTGYEVSGAMVDVRYVCKQKGMRYDVHSKAKKINAHVLLPKGKNCSKLLVNGSERAFESVSVGNSHYVDFCTPAESVTSIEIIF